MKKCLTLSQLSSNVCNIANSFRALKGFSKCKPLHVSTVIEALNFNKFYINLNKESGEIFPSLIIQEGKEWLSLSVEYLNKDMYKCEIL